MEPRKLLTGLVTGAVALAFGIVPGLFNRSIV